MISFVKAIHHNTNASEVRRKDLERIFPQLNVINEVRDAISHNFHDHHLSWTAIPDDPTVSLISNVDRASRFGNENEFLISVADIESMRSDLGQIRQSLVKHSSVAPDHEPFAPLVPQDVPIAWLYKPQRP